MRIALIPAPILGNAMRGVGVYGSQLTAHLKNIPGLEISGVPFDFWRQDYSDFDLVHFLYFDPFFLTLPPFRNRKTVVTVMDLTQIVLSDLYLRGIAGEVKWQIQKQLLKGVNNILTLSQSAKSDISRIIGYPEENISVTYLAPTGVIRTATKRQDYILYIGDINPNKNVSSLLKAVRLMTNKRLVLVGKAFLDPGLTEAKEIRKEIQELGINNQVELKGYVSEEEKRELLNRAGVYCQPSIYEGFGLPVLEAMAGGCPVVCGNNSSLPEVAGEAAIYADVTSPEDLAQKINGVFSMTKKELESTVKRGLVQAEKFSWEKTAKETAAVYRQMLG